MFKYPTTPKENWQDMISCYKISTDKELLELLEKIDLKMNEEIKAWTPVELLFENGSMTLVYVAKTQTQYIFTKEEDINEDGGIITADGKYATTMYPVKMVKPLEYDGNKWTFDLRDVSVEEIR